MSGSKIKPYRSLDFTGFRRYLAGYDKLWQLPRSDHFLHKSPFVLIYYLRKSPFIYYLHLFKSMQKYR